MTFLDCNLSKPKALSDEPEIPVFQVVQPKNLLVGIIESGLIKKIIKG